MKHYLIVDDSPSWNNYHYDNLKALYGDKIEIDRAYTAREAYDWVYNYLENPYDVIITDLSMEYDFSPKFAGEWLVEQIQLLKQYYKTKIVIISGSMQIKNIAEGFGTDYIPKAVIANDKTVYQKI
ncbi:response regulator [bacterium]|nr:response regulator [bacterium]